ncbi:hypothetical protein L6452_22031 [Arctium lappa]|uniref:Uncharacterized protein n=1 Tax=Arctium lappa TaxID=4217 RepID=A0ACB9AZK0_ARCLA|nr:hypothetical protein L6452_22031 [Arctium lappa]
MDFYVCMMMKFTLWNPSIRRKLTLPHHPFMRNYSSQESSDVSIGFGFHQVTNDYKIVRISFYTFKRVAPESCVYSINTGTWHAVASPTTPLSSVQCSACFFEALRSEGEIRKVLLLTTNGDLVFRTELEGSKVYNPTTGVRSRLVKFRDYSHHLEIKTYVESLVLLNKGTVCNGDQPSWLRPQKREIFGSRKASPSFVYEFEEKLSTSDEFSSITE